MLGVSSRWGSALQKQGCVALRSREAGLGAITTRHCLGFTLLQSEHCVKPWEKESVHQQAALLPACLAQCSSPLCDHLALWKRDKWQHRPGSCSCGNTQAAGEGCASLPASLQHCHGSVVLQPRGSRACGWKTQSVPNRPVPSPSAFAGD